MRDRPAHCCRKKPQAPATCGRDSRHSPENGQSTSIRSASSRPPAPCGRPGSPQVRLGSHQRTRSPSPPYSRAPTMLRPTLTTLATCSLLLPAAVIAADPETFTRHVVVSQEGNSAEASCREILRQGGKRRGRRAAVATAFALAVTHPAAGNLGGGGFLVAFDAGSRKVRTFDFRETAPRAATPTMYLGPDGRLPLDTAGRAPRRGRAGDGPRPRSGPCRAWQASLE